MLIIISSGDDLLAGGSEHDGVFILCRVATLDVAEGWVRIDYLLVAQVLECHLVFGGSGAVQPALAERQCAEVGVDQTQQVLGGLQAQWNIRLIKVLHVVAAVHIIVHVSLSCGAKGLDGIEFILFHASCLASLHNGHCFTSVYSVGTDGMPVEIPYGFDLVSLAVYFHLVGLHDLLDGLPDVTKPDVNAGGLDASVRGLLHSLQQLVVARVEGQREGAVDDAPVDVCAKIYLDYVVILQYGRISCKYEN